MLPTLPSNNRSTLVIISQIPFCVLREKKTFAYSLLIDNCIFKMYSKIKSIINTEISVFSYILT